MAWSYDPTVGRYRYPETGRLVSPTQIRNLVERRQEATQAEMRAISARLTKDQMSVADWQKEMRAKVKQAHIELYQVGKGGPDQMTKADYGRLGASLKKEYKYLDGFAADIAAGKLSPGAISVRSSMYGSASLLKEFEAGRHQSMLAAGYTHKRRITVEGRAE